MPLQTHLRILPIVFALGIILNPAQAKRPLTHQDYDSWRSIAEQQLSRDGRWLAYSYMPQDGDGDLVVRNLTTGKEYRESAGALPPPPIINPAEVNPEAEPPRRNITIRFTSDGEFVVASFFPSKADTDKAKKERKRPDEMPKGGLVIVRLADGSVTRVASVKSFQVPEKGGAWLAFLKEPKPEEAKPDAAKPEAARSDPAQDGDQRSRGGTATGGARETYGTDLVLRDLIKGESSDRVFASVLEYSFARDGRTLAYTVGSRKQEENGVFAVTPGAGAAPAGLLAGKGKYSKLVWDRQQTQMAFVSSRDDADAKPPKFKIYHWDRKAATAVELVAGTTPGFPTDLVVSDKGRLSFSRDGKRLYVQAAKPGKAEPESPAGAASTPASNGEKVVMDLWHWRDDRVQPIQRIRANQERARTYPGVYHLADKKYVQVASENIPSVTLADDGRQAIGTDDRPYRRMTDYDGSYADYYWINTTTGDTKQIATKVRGGFFGGGMQPALSLWHLPTSRTTHRIRRRLTALRVGLRTRRRQSSTIATTSGRSSRTDGRR
jgi:hypothetical protein